ncbi:MAG: imelysin family protein [Crocinitomicaceae bacterium]|nr:imelysin family protein [Crocinitomicaceae bacterium]
MKNYLIICLIAALLVGCKKDDKPEFDRKAMLTNMASTVIQPAYTGMAADLAALHTSATNFTANPTVTALNTLKSDFIEAYKTWQHCKMFDFGPMMDYGIKASMNTYPTDTVQIQNNVSTGVYTLTALENVDAIGFPAIDFLLYYQGETAVINSFTTDPNATNRKTYLTDVTAKMKSEFDLVVSGWSSYESSFIASDGNDAGSSTSLLFNEFVKDIELLKNAKIGIPAGQQTGGMPLPDYVEAYYSGISTSLAIESIIGLKNVFNGATGSGFDDYIKDVEGEDVTVSLADNINTQFDVCKSAVNTIGNPLSDKVTTANTTVNNAYLEIKKLVTYCKTDMSSTLGLLITFQDNDGD